MKVCLLLLFLLLTILVQAQSPTATADSLLNKRNFKAAIPLYQKAMLLQAYLSPEYLKTRNNLGLCYAVEIAKDSAEIFLMETQSLISASLGEKCPEYATALYNLGVFFLPSSKGKNAEKSEFYFLKAIELRELVLGVKHPDYLKAAKFLGLMLYYQAGKHQKAKPWLKKIVAIEKETLGEKSADYAGSINNLAENYRQMGSYAEAEPLYQQALAIKKEVLGEKHPSYAASLNNLAILYHLMGNYPSAEELYKQSMKIRKEILGEKNLDYLSSINNLASLYRQMGHYSSAETLFQQNLKIKKELLGEKHADYAASLNNLAILYREMGNYQVAEALYRQAMEIRKESLGEKHPIYAASLNNLAILYRQIGNFSAAEPLYQQAISISKEVLGEKHPNYTASLNNLAIFYRETGNFQAAEDLYQQTLNIGKETSRDKYPEYASSLIGLATLYSQMGKYQQAEQFFEQGLGIWRDGHKLGHPEYYFGLKASAEMYLSQKNPTKAIPLIHQTKNWALQHVKNNFPSLSENEKEQFYTNNIRPIIELFSAAATQYPSDSLIVQFYNLQLATKALLLNTSAKWKNNILNGGDKKIIDKLFAWKNSVNNYASYLNKTENFSAKTADSLLSVSNALEKELSIASDKFDKLEERNPKTWQNIKTKLKNGEACVEVIRIRRFGNSTKSNPMNPEKSFVEYGLSDSLQYAFLVVTNKSRLPEMILMKNGNEMERALKYHRNCIEYSVQDDIGYDLFWQKVAPFLKQNKINKVYFSPDGLYHQVSLPTLYNTKTGKYLADEIEVVNVSNTKDILNERQGGVKNYYALLLGAPDFGSDFVPLPGTKREVEAIGQNLRLKNWETEIRQGSEAHERVIKTVEKPRILHIATHGYFEPQNNAGQKDSGNQPAKGNPLLRSGLILSKDRSQDTLDWNNDGILTAYEAMTLNLDNTELVVLSACETGLGDVRYGEGVYGLQRAFKIAGANLILMSLWKVSDQATEEFMKLFYDQWLKTPNARQAFKSAQAIIRSKHPDPRLWGAFVLVGE